jgi:hypothetical protein
VPLCLNSHPANSDNQCSNPSCTYRVSARHKPVGEDNTKADPEPVFLPDED